MTGAAALDLDLRIKSDRRFQVFSSRYGLCALVAMQTGSSGLPLATLYHRVMPPIRLEQIFFLYRADGSPAAYATWAFVSDDTLAALGEGRISFLHTSEWNEGLNLVVMEFVAKPGVGLRMALMLRLRLAALPNEIFRFRRGRLKRLAHLKPVV